MSKKMLINASHPEENRVAIVVDGILSELDIEIAGQLQTKGNIYKAVVVRVEPGLQAAFVDYGAERHGFLQIGEIHPKLYPAKKSESKEYPRITEILQRGQEILVQVVKGERGTKGAALTTLLSLPGRYMVLMPDSNTKGVSRKIEDDKERKTLKKTMAQLNLPDEMGYIVRTAGIGKEEGELKRDFNYLVSLYKGILARKERVKAPSQLYQESDIVIRSIRDYFSTEMDEVLIDDSEVYRQARDFFSLVMPDQLHLVKQHREKRPIFSRYQIEEQIETLSHNKVPLPSGGSIVIDQTEALVAIDVNSGRMAGEKGIEATAARSNIEAAAEIGRQLRLRDLGGLIVIDFIDMRDRKKVREVEQTLNESVKDDKARISTARISQFGLLELSRQRIRPTLSVGAYLDCPNCQGKGRIKSPEAQAVALLRQLHASVSKGQIGTIKATIPLDVANYLHNERRQALTELERRFDLKIQILGSLDAIPEQIELELLKREKPQVENAEEVPVSHAEGLEQALAAANEPEVVPEIITETTVTDAAESTEATPNAELTPEGEPVKRKRRRRRRRRSGASETAPTEGQTADESSDSVEQESNEPASAEVALETPEVEVKKPARRSRRPAAKKVEEPTNEVQTSIQAEDQTQTQAGTTSEATPDVSPESPAAKPQGRGRGRRPAAKKVAETTPEVGAETPTPIKERPQSRPRRPAAKKTAEIPAAVAVETMPIKTEAPAVEKPQRRPRKPTAKKVTETPAADTAETITPVAEKPQRSPRRPSAKKTTETPAVVATETTAPVVEKPQRTPRRPAAKKTVETPAAVVIETTPEAAEKPARRPRRPAAKKATETTSETPLNQTPTAVETAVPSSEKPKRRTRKPPAKKDETKKSELDIE